MEINSFYYIAAEACLCAYKGLDYFKSKEYLNVHSYQEIEENLQIEKQLTTIVKLVNKHLFKKDVLSEIVTKNIPLNAMMSASEILFNLYNNDKEKIYFALFDAIKEFHDTMIYNSNIDFNESFKSYRPNKNKIFEDLSLQEFSKDYFLFNFVSKYFTYDLTSYSNSPYASFPLKDDVIAYYKKYMGNNYKEETETTINDEELLENIVSLGISHGKHDKNENEMQIFYGPESPCKKFITPETIDNKEMTCIACCFHDWEKEYDLEEVIINSNKVEIYDSFFGCNKLSRVTIKGELIRVNNIAFADCPLITTIDQDIKYTTINDNPYYIAQENNDVEQEFIEINEQTLIIAPDFSNYGQVKTLDLSNVKYVMEDSFCYNYELNMIFMSNNIEYIGRNAFSSCTSLTDLEFPKSIKLIEEFAFNDCPNLKKVRVPKTCVVEEYAFDSDCLIERY